MKAKPSYKSISYHDISVPKDYKHTKLLE